MITHHDGVVARDGGNGSNGNGGLSGLPPWVRGIAIIGIPGAIACFLVWIVGAEIPRISAVVTANGAQIAEVRAQQKTDAAAAAERDKDMLRLMELVCAGVNNTEAGRRACFARRGE